LALLAKIEILQMVKVIERIPKEEGLDIIRTIEEINGITFLANNRNAGQKVFKPLQKENWTFEI
jgi:hypothetical protein